MDRIGTFVAFKLVAGAQQGRPIELAVLNDTTLNPPKFDCPIAPSPSPSQDSGPPPQVQQRSASVTSRSSIGGLFAIIFLNMCWSKYFIFVSF